MKNSKFHVSHLPNMLKDSIHSCKIMLLVVFSLKKLKRYNGLTHFLDLSLIRKYMDQFCVRINNLLIDVYIY